MAITISLAGDAWRERKPCLWARCFLLPALYFLFGETFAGLLIGGITWHTTGYKLLAMGTTSLNNLLTASKIV